MNTPSGFIVLCAPTARSQAYLQAMKATNLRPEHVVVYGCSRPRNQFSRERRHHLDIFLPDFEIPIEQTIDKAGWKVTYCDDDDLSSGKLIDVLHGLMPDLTVFSGFGGQLVRKKTLDAVGSLLHIHSGWLPEYRGSTTLYYSLLNEKRCAASALLLTEDIDDGPVLARKYYPPPSKNCDIDYAYDCSIRADLLVTVLKKYTTNKKLPDPASNLDEGEMYYVIHPLLKHLAILSLKDN